MPAERDPESVLRDREEELRDFLENAVDGMHWAGPDGTILWANGAELALLGYSRDEYVGHNIAEFHADPALVEDILARLRRNEALRNHEAVMRRKDGSLRHVVINSSVFWRNGEFVHTRCVTRDVTDQKRLEHDRERATRHLGVEYAVGRILTDALRLDDVVPPLLETVCMSGDWQVGAMWIVDESAELLRCVDVWHVPEMDLKRFETITRNATFECGKGLPGRVWATAAPVWIADVDGDPAFLRGADAIAAGLHGAVGFPIRVRDRITGVLEFFGREAAEPHPDLLRLLDAIGVRIGHFTERREGDVVRARLAAIVDSSDDAIVSKTLDGVITSWNRGAENMFGYTAAEAVGKHISLIIPREGWPEEEQVLAKLRRGERIEHYETERQAKDGRRLSISLTVSPIRNSDGTIVGASKVARDMTDRKRAATALAESERRFRELNRVGVAVASSLDRSSIVQTVIDLAREVIHADFGAFYTPGDAEARDAGGRLAPLISATLRGEGLIRLDDVTTDSRCRLDAADAPPLAAGDRPIRSYLAVPVTKRSGEVLGGLFFGGAKAGMFTDQHEQLVEGIAAWASIALENARLHADIEQAVQARDDFLSLASHELRNPLNALQLQLVGLHRSAQQENDDLSREWVCDRLSQATDDVAVLVRLVHNLLDVARIAADRMDIEPEEIDFASAIEAVVKRFGQQVNDRRLVLDVAPVTGRSDRLRFEQIVTNLVSNAFKYGQGKPIELSLRADEDTVYFSVTDHGIGIDPADLPQLFERFSRAVSRREYGGFGLGLWIARETVRAMGGQISVVSQPGQGSTFSVSLPRTLTLDGLSSSPARAGASM